MKIKKFSLESDLDRLSAFLRERYFESGSEESWLPERLHDIIFRMGPTEAAEGEQSCGFIYLWENEGEIAACILPDGENIYFSAAREYEHLFEEMLSFAEKNCLPLFHVNPDGTLKFWVAVSSRKSAWEETLAGRGYGKYPENEYSSVLFPAQADISVKLPDGFSLKFGEDYPDEEKKWSALVLGFHPDREAPDYRADMAAYEGRKKSPLYPGSFECLVIDENCRQDNSVCSYCFVYADKASRTAVIEPVSTREKYRGMGFGTAMMHAAAARCGQLGIERVYVNSFGSSRKDFYNAAGFNTETEVHFWYKTLNADK